MIDEVLLLVDVVVEVVVVEQVVVYSVMISTAQHNHVKCALFSRLYCFE
jgi:hypothetical protein